MTTGQTFEADITEQDITFTCDITEFDAIKDAEEWSGEGVNTAPDGDQDIAEIMAKDDKPFFVVLSVLREGWGSGKPEKKWYTEQAVRSTARLCLDRLGYKGHQKPENRSSEYRNPEMRIIKTKLATVTVDGQPRLVCKAKAYVSKNSQDLRTHIGEKMAGPVSIDGRATLRRTEDRLEVVDMQEIRCVDFCNPHTEGMKGMGVEEVVSEMKDTTNPEGDSTMADKRLSVPELVGTYGAEIREMEREAVEKAESPLTSKIEGLETNVSELKTEVTTKGDEIKILTEKNVQLEKDLTEMTEKNEKIEKRSNSVELDKFIADEITEMKVSEFVAAKLKARVSATVIGDDTDLVKSKAAIKETITAQYADIKEMVEASGGSMTGKNGDGGGAGKGNPPREGEPPEPGEGREKWGSFLAGADKSEKK